MSEQRTFEDVIRSVIRRWQVILLSVAALTTLGAVYGKLVNASASYSAEASVSLGSPNVVLLGSDDPQAPQRLLAGPEADLLASRLVEFAGPDFEDVSVRSTTSNSSIIVTARGSSAADAEQLALSTSSAYVADRRESGRELYRLASDAQAAQADAFEIEIANLDEQLAASTTDSTGLQLQRIQLVEELLRNRRLAANAASNAERYDAGLGEPVLIEPAVSAGSSGWILFGGVGAMLGVLAGVGFALMLQSIDHRIRSRSDVERVASGIPVIGVVSRSGPDPDELDAIEARVRGRAEGNPVVFLAGAATESLAAGVLESLRKGGVGDVVRDMAGTDGRAMIVGVRSGQTKDVDLVAVLSDLELRRVPVLGVLLWDVADRDLRWARRPLLLRS